MFRLGTRIGLDLYEIHEGKGAMVDGTFDIIDRLAMFITIQMTTASHSLASSFIYS